MTFWPTFLAHHFLARFRVLARFFNFFDPRQIFRIFASQVSLPQFSIDYIDHQWIDDNAFFNPSTWSQYMQHTRTTNSHEGWHNRMKSAADRKSKLNFYKLVELMYYQVSLVPLQCALLCQNKLREHTTKAAGSTNKKLFDLWE